MRNLLLFCAYFVVVVTLVGQGPTFGPLLRRLRLSSSAVDEALVRNQARLAAVRASLDRLDETLTDVRSHEAWSTPCARQHCNVKRATPSGSSGSRQWKTACCPSTTPTTPLSIYAGS